MVDVVLLIDNRCIFKKIQEGFPSQSVGLFNRLPDKVRSTRNQEFRARIIKKARREHFLLGCGLW